MSVLKPAGNKVMDHLPTGDPKLRKPRSGGGIPLVIVDQNLKHAPISGLGTKAGTARRNTPKE